MFIVTHQNPDWDALCGVWLIKKFVSPEAEVKFVNTGNPDEMLLNQAMAVVDTGKKFIPIEWRFDHHQFPGDEANLTCATEQVYLHLLNLNYKIGYLQPLINLVYQGDTGKQDANFSRELGLHALLSGFKRLWAEIHQVKFTPDNEILNFGFQLLDMMDNRLESQANIRTELADKVVYKSDDGLLWAIRFGSAGSSFAAFDEGARLVVFEGEPIEVEGGTTYPIGIMRAGEWNEPNCGELTNKMIEITEYELASGTIGDFRFEATLQDELKKWFNHPAGFFSGRGTAKAPVFDAVKVNLEQLAKMVDKTWLR